MNRVQPSLLAEIQEVLQEGNVGESPGDLDEAAREVAELLAEHGDETLEAIRWLSSVLARAAGLVPRARDDAFAMEVFDAAVRAAISLPAKADA